MPTDTQTVDTGISGPFDMQCSNFIDGKCQFKNIALLPWSNWFVLDTDYETYTVVYGCNMDIAGMTKFNFVYSLTRVPLAIATSAHDAIKDITWPTFNSVPGVDADLLYSVAQTSDLGC